MLPRLVHPLPRPLGTCSVDMANPFLFIGSSCSRQHSTSTKPVPVSTRPVPSKAPASNNVAPSSNPVSGGGGGGGFLRDVVTNATSIGIGHTLGRALSGALGLYPTGSSGEAAALPSPAYEAAPQQQQQQYYGQASTANPSQNSFSDSLQRDTNNGPCAYDSARFVECMTARSDDVSACQTYMDLLKACQQTQSRSFNSF